VRLRWSQGDLWAHVDAAAARASAARGSGARSA
jgi:hypothetical protein